MTWRVPCGPWWGLLLGLLAWTGTARAQLARQEPPELSAAIAGRVCLDADGDGQCAPGEAGLPGIRLVLSTGREVRTDAGGRYHFTQVDARSLDMTGGVHLRPGRHRLRLDTRALPPDSVVSPDAATLEVTWASLVLQDFAVRIQGKAPPPVALAYDASPPAARVIPGGVEFLLAGHVEPREEVTVDGVSASVDARGDWRARVQLVIGENVLPLMVRGTDGLLSLFQQRIDVVPREGGLLVIPRTPEPRGVFRLPGSKDAPPASGSSSLTTEFPPGTRIRSPQGEVTVGAGGSALLPLELVPGSNPVVLEVQPPGEPAWSMTVPVEAVRRQFAVGLLDLEAGYSFSEGVVRVRGRGSAHVEAHHGPFSLMGELDLRDTDVESLRGRSLLEALRPRISRLDRVPDPELNLPEWADTSVGFTPNPAESRLRLELSHEHLGRVGLGTYRARLEEGEVGRYHRPLFGPSAELATELGPVRVGVTAFAGGLADPLRALSTQPAYEELRATGGSLHYLGAVPVAEGSEVLRVEVRDGLTGLPLAERHLMRGRDYDIDYTAGRILLARPLSFVAGEPLVRTGPPTTTPEPVLCVEYAVLRSGAPEDTVGGKVWAEWQGGRASVSAVSEPRDGRPYHLFAGHARTTLGGYTLLAEVARSRGTAVRWELFGISDDGGLSFLRPVVGEPLRGGDALGMRVRGPGLFGQGSVDAAFRRRTAGYSDGTHADPQSSRQLSLRAVQPVGPWRFTLLGDDRLGVDPRAPFRRGSLGARTLSLGVGHEWARWGVSAELRDARLLASERPGEGPLLDGGRTSVGLEGHYQLTDWLRVSASHRQTVGLRGEGPGRVDDTFFAAGVDVTKGDATVGVRGGWGPRLGPLAWLRGGWKRGDDVYYGSYSVDVDGPDFGSRRVVSGASTRLEDGTSVFVEDVAAHDPQGLRLARAVGFQRTVFGALDLGARYERGVRGVLFDAPSSLRRDAAGVSGQLVLERLRVGGNLELRSERGTPERGSTPRVDRLQTVAMLAVEGVLREDLTVSGRTNLSRTVEGTSGRVEAGLFESYTALAWRPGAFALVARYGILRELSPGERAVFGERSQQVISLLPALRLGERFALSAGLHASRSRQGTVGIWVFTGSLRPSVRVVGGLEVAVETVARSVAADNESLYALRGEVAWRVDPRMRVGVGYTVLGFTETGLPGESSNGSNKLYVRAELAY